MVPFLNSNSLTQPHPPYPLGPLQAHALASAGIMPLASMPPQLQPQYCQAGVAYPGQYPGQDMPLQQQQQWHTVITTEPARTSSPVRQQQQQRPSSAAPASSPPRRQQQQQGSGSPPPSQPTFQLSSSPPSPYPYPPSHPAHEGGEEDADNPDYLTTMYTPSPGAARQQQQRQGGGGGSPAPPGAVAAQPYYAPASAPAAVARPGGGSASATSLVRRGSASPRMAMSAATWQMEPVPERLVGGGPQPPPWAAAGAWAAPSSPPGVGPLHFMGNVALYPAPICD